VGSSVMMWPVASCNHCNDFYPDELNDIMFMPILGLEDVTAFSFEWRLPVSVTLQSKGWMRDRVGVVMNATIEPDKLLKVAARHAGPCRRQGCTISRSTSALGRTPREAALAATAL